MIDVIYQAIETRLLAHADFDGFGFYRFVNDWNSNQQSRGSIPYLALAWNTENSTKADLIRMNNRLSLTLRAVWASATSDINAFAKIQEQKKYIRAAKEAVFPQADENYLGIEQITDFEFRSVPLEIGGIEHLEHNGIQITINLTYIETIG